MPMESKDKLKKTRGKHKGNEERLGTPRTTKAPQPEGSQDTFRKPKEKTTNNQRQRKKPGGKPKEMKAHKET